MSRASSRTSSRPPTECSPTSSPSRGGRSEEHTSELQSPCNLVCRLLLEKKKHTSELQSPCNLVCRLLLEKKKKQTVLKPHRKQLCRHDSQAQTRAKYVLPEVSGARVACYDLVSIPAYWILTLSTTLSSVACDTLLYTCLSFIDFSFFFFNDTATTEIYTLSLHDALLFFLKDPPPPLLSPFPLLCPLLI